MNELDDTAIAAWVSISKALKEITPPNTVLTHFKTRYGNGYTTSTEQTTEDLIVCYNRLKNGSKTASELMSITSALHLHLL